VRWRQPGEHHLVHLTASDLHAIFPLRAASPRVAAILQLLLALSLLLEGPVWGSAESALMQRSHAV
jgi:hypothetical protein